MLRDDLSHPLLGGNKFRKLDGLWPNLQCATHAVTCGGLQSAHTTAVAAVCARHGIKAHLLVRGERPAVPTGHHLYARMLGEVVYVTRAEYADRGAMLEKYAQQLVQQEQHPGGEQDRGAERVLVIPEGAAMPEALLGSIRLVRWLAQESELAGRECHLVVDSGTGATATGLAVGVSLLDLPWQVTGVALAGPLSYFAQQQHSLVQAFTERYLQLLAGTPMLRPGPGGAAGGVYDGVCKRLQDRVGGVLMWVERSAPRKFGKVLDGEVARCRRIGQQHGIIVDPIWTLAAWEVAEAMAAGTVHSELAGRGGEQSIVGGAEAVGLQQESVLSQEGGSVVVMVHTGGMLGLCGLAQRYPDQF